MTIRDVVRADPELVDACKLAKGFVVAGIMTLFVGMLCRNQDIRLPFVGALFPIAVALFLGAFLIWGYVLYKARRTQVVGGNVQGYKPDLWIVDEVGEIDFDKLEAALDKLEAAIEEAQRSVIRCDKLYLSALDHMEDDDSPKEIDHIFPDRGPWEDSHD